MAAMEGSEIKEGFLCPLCLQDLRTITQLQYHFENSHSTEDRAGLHALLDFFGKAKKKILNLDSSSEEESNATNPFLDGNTSTSTYDPSVWQHQELGATFDHSTYFKMIRESRMDRYVVETNRLIIRLEKLLTNAPSEPTKKKQHEQAVVEWVSDADVKLCPTCGRSFSLARRRHHCRLCGSIMCDPCSEFISFASAIRLTQPIGEDGESVDQFEDRTSSRRGSTASTTSTSSSTSTSHLRVCRECKKLLDRREQQIVNTSNRPVILHMYEKLKKCIDDADSKCPTYIQMAESLNSGEPTTYSLQEVQLLRLKLMKLAEAVDLISKKIVNEPPANNSSYQLQKTIRLAASGFLQDKMVGLPSIPTDTELAKLQEQYKQRLAAQQDIQQQLPQPAPHQTEDTTSFLFRPFRSSSPKKQTPPHSRTPSDQRSVVSEGGWGPENEQAAQFTDNQDPMVQQMNIIRNYIRQAKQAHREDEVHMLEANLKELQEEYWRQRIGN